MLGDIKHFMDRIMAITPGMPDFMGNGGAENGAADVAGPLVYALREAAIRFARAYAGAADFDDVRRLAAETEGKLLTVATVMRLPAERTDDLVNELHILLAAKAG